MAASPRRSTPEARRTTRRGVNADRAGRTLSDAELLDDALTAEQLLLPPVRARGRRRDRPRALAYGCRCSRSRLAGILEGFPADDLDHMAVAGDIVMTCEFCNLEFRFPRETVQGS